MVHPSSPWCRSTLTTNTPRNAESQKTCYLQSVLECIKERLTWWLATSMVPHGHVDQVTSSGATALLRRRLSTRTCQFRMALQHCGGQVEFLENGPKCAVSSSHPVLRLSGFFACTVRSNFLMKFSESNLPTRVATTKYGFISCTSAHGWLTGHRETGNIGGQPSGKGTVRTTTSRTT